MTGAPERLEKPRLRKRFYKDAGWRPEGDGFVITLDGKAARTVGGALLRLPEESLAAAVAAEWAGQGAEIDPTTMPMTRLAITAIDGVAANAEAVRKEVVAYAGSDLLCYRAASPAVLVAQQQAEWDPILAWAESDLGARLGTGTGIIAVPQPAASLDAIAAVIADTDPITLAALHIATTLTGSALLALAVAHGRLAADDAWRAAHVDEDWQASQWGEVAEAVHRRALRWRDMEAAARVLATSWRRAGRAVPTAAG